MVKNYVNYVPLVEEMSSILKLWSSALYLIYILLIGIMISIWGGKKMAIHTHKEK